MFVEVNMYMAYENKDFSEKELINLDNIIKITKHSNKDCFYYELNYGNYGFPVSEETGLKIINLLKEKNMIMEV